MGAGVQAWGPGTGPLACLPCWALRAVVVAGGCPGGGGGSSRCCEGLQGVRRSPSPGCPSLGQAVGVRCPHVVRAGARAWGPGTGPLACMPCWTLRAVEPARGCPGGGSSGRGEGRLASGAQPPPAARPLGRQSGSVALALRAREVRVWEPGTDLTADAVASWRGMLWGLQEGIPGGGASCLRDGRLGLGAQPPPAARPWNRQPRSAAHMLWVKMCRRGDSALAPWLACPA